MGNVFADEPNAPPKDNIDLLTKMRERPESHNLEDVHTGMLPTFFHMLNNHRKHPNTCYFS